MCRIEYTKIRLAKKYIIKDEQIRYLQVLNLHLRRFEEILERRFDEEFGRFVNQNVEMYMEGKVPDEAILPAVMNISDDIAAGREPVLRAGDYIALQKAFKRG